MLFNMRYFRIHRLIILLLVFFLAGWMDPYKDHVSEGNSKFHNKDFPGALKSYKQAENYLPSDEDKNKLAFNRGDAEYGAGNYEKAITEYKRALGADDSEVQKKAFLNMGNSYLEMKKYKDAVDSYMNALKIDPQYAKAKNNLEYLFKMKDRKKKQNKDKDKDNDKKGDQKKDQDKKKKDNQNKNKDEKKDSSKQQKEKQPSGKKMSREQVKNILESMKNKPVRRQKGKLNERRNLEKNW